MRNYYITGRDAWAALAARIRLAETLGSLVCLFRLDAALQAWSSIVSPRLRAWRRRRATCSAALTGSAPPCLGGCSVVEVERFAPSEDTAVSGLSHHGVMRLVMSDRLQVRASPRPGLAAIGRSEVFRRHLLDAL